jgi:hypothetical protein
MRSHKLLSVFGLILACAVYGAGAAAEKSVKQPVFVLCPHTEHYSAWSLYLTVDESDPRKVLSLGLEKLVRKNSKDSSYDEVVAAQSDPKVEREQVASIDAKDFGSGQLNVAKDDALHVSLSPIKDGYTLMVSLRISADERFVIGGKDARKRDVALTYDAISKHWIAQVKQLRDDKGAAVNGAPGTTMTGIQFNVTGTGIYMVVGRLDTGDEVVLLDRGGMKE